MSLKSWIRCEKYDLKCAIDNQPWAANAQQLYRTTVLEASSRTTFWGPTSNSGGNPSDLHSGERLPGSNGSKPTSLNQAAVQRRNGLDRNVLDLDPNVKSHLFDIYLKHIQPFFPVVSSYSIQAYPPTPLLEAVICAVAAKHRLAIASWRDLEYTRGFIQEQLAQMFSLRAKYEPKVQTVQALVIACARFEILNKDYADFLNVAITMALMCKMAQDLMLDESLKVNDDTDDTKFRRQLWKSCMFMDVFKAAIYGQTPNLHQDYWIGLDRSLLLRRETGPLSPSDIAFDDFVALACHLERIIRSLYITQRSEPSKLLGQITSIFHLLDRCQKLVSSHLHLYDHDTSRALQMYVHNNRLLIVLGVKLSELGEGPAISELKGIVEQQRELVVHEAIQTLSWLDGELTHSPFTEMGFILYFVSRALLVVVSQLNTLGTTSAQSNPLVSRLLEATESARSFSDRLLELNRWGVEWYQAHTIRGILGRINVESRAPVEYESQPVPQEVEPSFDELSMDSMWATEDWEALVESCGFDSWIFPNFESTL
ncbi:unnamed protein product [Clonostachys solani]|uniref:Xylanolytic transcriptional activator regulatory domain-containing protein n=1 Tax=Clonostachys solani TaxID=160281 RepID=A0A9N9YZ03_9HYPO|nr:unnamed protein product [Clonostachys solani]